MSRLHVKLIKWISNKFGYKIAMLKASNGTTTIEGNIELLRYVDISGYFFKVFSAFFFRLNRISLIRASIQDHILSGLYRRFGKTFFAGTVLLVTSETQTEEK